jgi:predicted cupin superfamily sugar epimerase
VYSGGALELSTWDGDAPSEVKEVVLGPDLSAGQRPQALMAAGIGQTARPLAPWVLAGCTVCPAFEFRGFELAIPEWAPSASPLGSPSVAGFSSTNPHQA